MFCSVHVTSTPALGTQPGKQHTKLAEQDLARMGKTLQRPPA